MQELEVETESSSISSRGRGWGHNQRQRGGKLRMQSKHDILALLQEVRQRRQSLDSLLDQKNSRSSYLRNLYHILKDIGGDLEKQCMDSIYAVAMMYCAAKQSGRPAIPSIVFPGQPMSTGTSGVTHTKPYNHPSPPHHLLPTTHVQESMYHHPQPPHDKPPTRPAPKAYLYGEPSYVHPPTHYYQKLSSPSLTVPQSSVYVVPPPGMRIHGEPLLQQTQSPQAS